MSTSSPWVYPAGGTGASLTFRLGYCLLVVAAAAGLEATSFLAGDLEVDRLPPVAFFIALLLAGAIFDITICLIANVTID